MQKGAVYICRKQALLTEAERQQFSGQAVLINVRSGTYCIRMSGWFSDPFTLRIYSEFVLALSEQRPLKPKKNLALKVSLEIFHK